MTDWPGSENSPRFSPDGRWLAFDAEVDGQSDLYLLSLVDGEVRRLTDSRASDRRPAWSPDGRAIAFQSDRTGSWAIWKIGVEGGEPRLVFGDENRNAIAPDWSPGGRLVATVLERDPAYIYGRATPWILSDGAGAARALTDGGDEWFARWITDSEWLVYYKGRDDRIEMVDSGSGEVRSLSRGEYVGWNPVVSPSGRNIAFASNVGRWRPSLWLATVDYPSDLRRLTSGAHDDMPSWSPDGRWIAFSSDRSPTTIVALDVATRERSTLVQDATDPQPLAEGGLAYLQMGTDGWQLMVASEGAAGTADARRVATPPGGLEAFAIATGGESVAYVAGGSRPLHRADLYRTVAVGKSSRRLTELGEVSSPVWCDDGSLLFSSYGPTRGDFRQIWRFETQRDALLQITSSRRDKAPLQCRSNPERITARWTSDASGVYDLERFDDEWREQLVAEASEGRWSPDGRRLAYIAPVDGRTDLFLRSVDGSSERVTDDELVEESISWSADGRRLIFAARAPQRDLWLVEASDLPELPARRNPD